mmetsp:Transcript_34090/g.67476  ORF Transcript_34090/g.67476 Transcript_34090/m.67476 type:complete len:108 (+) Transcript_34090:249-572(+)
MKIHVSRGKDGFTSFRLPQSIFCVHELSIDRPTNRLICLSTLLVECLQHTHDSKKTLDPWLSSSHHRNASSFFPRSHSQTMGRWADGPSEERERGFLSFAFVALSRK